GPPPPPGPPPWRMAVAATVPSLLVVPVTTRGWPTVRPDRVVACAVPLVTLVICVDDVVVTVAVEPSGVAMVSVDPSTDCNRPKVPLPFWNAGPPLPFGAPWKVPGPLAATLFELL